MRLMTCQVPHAPAIQRQPAHRYGVAIKDGQEDRPGGVVLGQDDAGHSREGLQDAAPNFRPSYGFGAEIASRTSGKVLVADVTAAAAYLRTLKEVDPDRVCVLGASFGGYAALRTIIAKPSVFAAAVDLNGPSDLTALYADVPAQRPAMTSILGGSPDQQPERYEEESPIRHCNAIAIPVLVVHGTADTAIPYNQSVKFVAAPQKAGRSAKLISYKDVDHGFPLPVLSNAMQQSLAFLRKQLNGPTESGDQKDTDNQVKRAQAN
jgi:dipeptidyl aminopeptidase/acylaminoacyl peptidase